MTYQFGYAPPRFLGRKGYFEIHIHPIYHEAIIAEAKRLATVRGYWSEGERLTIYIQGRYHEPLYVFACHLTKR